jgi:hypothetical protein
MSAVIVKTGCDQQGSLNKHIATLNRVGQLKFAIGQRSGFVKRNGFQQPATFEVGTAFDKDAMPGRRRKSTDYRYRGGAQGQAMTSNTSAL